MEKAGSSREAGKGGGEGRLAGELMGAGGKGCSVVFPNLTGFMGKKAKVLQRFMTPTQTLQSRKFNASYAFIRYHTHCKS